MATQVNTNDHIDVIDAVTLKLSHASGIVDLIRSSENGAGMREHSLTEAADAVLVMLDDVRELLGRRAQA